MSMTFSLAEGAPGGEALDSLISLGKYGLRAFLNPVLLILCVREYLKRGSLRGLPIFLPLSWFLALMLDAASVGIYSACMMCIQVMNPFLLGLNSLLVPKTAHAYAEEGVSALKSKVRWTTFCLGGATGVFAIVASIWGPSVLEYIYRAQAFEIPTPVVAALTFGLFIEICGTGPENGLWAMERHDLNFRAEIIAAVVSVLGACYLIWAFGLVGAALSFLVGRTLTSVSHWIAFRHAIKSQTA